MPHIHSVLSDVPEYSITQMEYYDYVAPRLRPRLRNILQRIIEGTQIRKRHFSTSVEHMFAMTEERKIGEKFSIWKETTMEFWTKQCKLLIENSGLSVDEIDGICTSTTTGFVTPGPTVLLQSKVGLRPDIVHMPIVGFGCSGGQAAIHRVNEYLTAFPKKAFLVCIGEAVSTQYEKADSISGLVANSIFADGFATLLMVGAENKLAKKSQIELLRCKSILFPNCDFAVGQWMSDEGMHNHIDAKLPTHVKRNIKEPIENLLAEAEQQLSDVDYFICHAGGPKVMETFQEVFELSDNALDITMETFRNYGNQSAVSVINALHRCLNTQSENGLGFMMALGPGIHMEYCLCKVTPRPENNVASQNASNKTEDYPRISEIRQVLSA